MQIKHDKKNLLAFTFVTLISAPALTVGYTSPSGYVQRFEGVTAANAADIENAVKNFYPDSKVSIDPVKGTVRVTATKKGERIEGAKLTRAIEEVQGVSRHNAAQKASHSQPPTSKQE